MEEKLIIRINYRELIYSSSNYLCGAILSCNNYYNSNTNNNTYKYEKHPKICKQHQ